MLFEETVEQEPVSSESLQSEQQEPVVTSREKYASLPVEEDTVEPELVLNNSELVQNTNLLSQQLEPVVNSCEKYARLHVEEDSVGQVLVTNEQPNFVSQCDWSTVGVTMSGGPDSISVIHVEVVTNSGVQILPFNIVPTKFSDDGSIEYQLASVGVNNETLSNFRIENNVHEVIGLLSSSAVVTEACTEIIDETLSGFLHEVIGLPSSSTAVTQASPEIIDEKLGGLHKK